MNQLSLKSGNDKEGMTMKRTFTTLIGAVLLAVALIGTGCVRHWHDDDGRRDSRNHHDYRDNHHDRYDHRYR
jgi:hypothetical protein